MQELQMTHAVGAILQDRYVIEDLLGYGGFGAVYRARDERSDGTLVALKELRSQDAREKSRLFHECEILQRLHYPALPSVEGVFEEDNRVYMVMDYIEGPNLELLRKEQKGQRFTYEQVVKVMASIVQAIEYLHRQQPPLMHRDIKPANIIVSKNGDGAVLVDFGIAKEYQSEATTTAVRHCSPGYSAPEQYSSMGTNPQADIYSLGATCYTLLTGNVPVDALERMTGIASRSEDTLKHVLDLVPNTPIAAARTIERAMSINSKKRFETAEDFWRAFTGEVVLEEEPSSVASVNTSGHLASVGPLNVEGSASTKGRRQQKSVGRIVIPIVAAVVVLALLAGGLVYAARENVFGRTVQIEVTRVIYSTPGLTKTVPNPYPSVAATYQGTFSNLLTNGKGEIRLTGVKQNMQTINGTFVQGKKAGKPFSGVIDASRHVLLTVGTKGQGTSLFFDGTMRSDGIIVGNYCTQDQNGQCVSGDYGLWTLSPIK
jgi:eukaryotic-like serine/threonine-protein kinase